MENVRNNQIEQENTLKEYLGLISRRKFLILGILFLIQIPIFIYTHKIPDIYSAYTTIVSKDDAAAGILSDRFGPSRRSFNYYMGIFSSRSFLLEVADSLGYDALPVDSTPSRAAEYIKTHMFLSESSFHSFLNINTRAENPELAFNLAKYGTDIFIEKCKSVVAEEASNRVRQIEDQLEIIKRKLAQSESEYQLFRDEIGLLSSGVADDLENLQNIYQQLRRQATLKDAVYSATVSQLREVEKKLKPEKEAENAEYKRINEKLREKEKQKQRLESIGVNLSTSSHLLKEIEELEQQLVNISRKEKSDSNYDYRLVSQWQELRKEKLQQQMDLNLLNKQIGTYERRIKQYKNKNPELVKQSLELKKHQRAVKVYGDTYDILLEKLEEAKIEKASITGGLKIIDHAEFPSRPDKKNKAVYFVIGIIAGLILGFGGAYFYESLDTTIKTTDAMEKKLGLAVIGTIPHFDLKKDEEGEEKTIIKRKGKDEKPDTVKIYPKQLINFHEEDSIISEAYRSLRTNLFFSSPDKPLKSILVSSSGPHEGKSLSVANLALACAEMGKKVLLVDSDLRRPVIHHLFQLERERGFSDLFVEGTDPFSIVKIPKNKELNVITAGRFTPNPSELLGSKKFGEILKILEEKFDLIMFDTPPVLAVTDAVLLSAIIDGVILVVRAGETEEEVAQRAIGNFNNVKAHLVGGVLNDIDLTHKYSSYGYYKYYYHYYRAHKT
ncbi:MAG: polysaccharide biosynthesis tyrosine autokinase [Fibrobacterota bacterium]